MAKRDGCIGIPIGHHDESRPLRDGHRRTHGHAENQLTTGGATGLANLRVGSSVGSEKSVPEKVNHCEIAVRVEMVDEVKLLLAPEPSQACKARPFDVVFLVKIYVRVERRRAGSDRYDEQVERENKKHPTGDENRGDEKVRRVVSFVATIGGGHEVSLGVIPMMKSDVVPVEDAAYPVMTEAVMEQSLAARYHQMGTDGS
jgi:hypothetical protein